MTTKNSTKQESTKETMLTDITTLNFDDIIFSEVIEGSIPNSPIKYQRIQISVKNPNGSVGELILSLDKRFSFGVSVNTDLVSGKVNGFSLPLVLWDREGPTEEQKQWTDKFSAMIDNRIKNYLLNNKDEIGQYDLEEAHLKKLNPLYWRKEKGKIVEGTGPTLYPKLLVSRPKTKKGNDKKPVVKEETVDSENDPHGGLKITTMFYDNHGKNVEGINLIGQYCNVNNSAIKIESIYFGGGKITLQVKVYEAEVEKLSNEKKPLLKRPVAQEVVQIEKREVKTTKKQSEEKEERTGSIDASENVQEEKPARKLKKVVPKKTVS